MPFVQSRPKCRCYHLLHLLTTKSICPSLSIKKLPTIALAKDTHSKIIIVLYKLLVDFVLPRGYYQITQVCKKKSIKLFYIIHTHTKCLKSIKFHKIRHLCINQRLLPRLVHRRPPLLCSTINKEETSLFFTRSSIKTHVFLLRQRTKSQSEE